MSTAISAIEIPPEILASPLFVRRGFVIVPALFTEQDLEELTAEAFAVRPTAVRNVLEADRAEALERGGAPARAFASAHGRAVQWRLFSAPALLTPVRELCGLTAVPTGGGSFTYYEQPGDFLGLHRDIVTCDLAIITCVRETASSSAGGSLLLYPEYSFELLSAVSAAGRAAGTAAHLRRGDTIILLGGIVPHEVLPMERGQDRIVSVMCYRILPRTNDLRAEL